MNTRTSISLRILYYHWPAFNWQITIRSTEFNQLIPREFGVDYAVDQVGRVNFQGPRCGDDFGNVVRILEGKGGDRPSRKSQMNPAATDGATPVKSLN
ncbi:MAG: hypothetical protein R6U93_04125 [Dehalococcoidia bacterium]